MKKTKIVHTKHVLQTPGRGEGRGGGMYSRCACLTTVVERPISREQLPIFNRSFIFCQRCPPPPPPFFVFMHMFAPILSAANPSPGDVIFNSLISVPPSSCSSMIQDVVEGDGDGKHLTWPTLLIIFIVVQNILGSVTAAAAAAARARASERG